MRYALPACATFWTFVLFALTGCASKPLTPPQAPPAVEVMIPVPVPCQVAQVPRSPLPSRSRAIPNDIFDAVKIVLADRAVLKADRERLIAANSNPCPVKP